MIIDIYKKALSVLMKRPMRLWGVSLLCSLLILLAMLGFAGIAAVGFAIVIAFQASMTRIFLGGYRDGIEPKAADLFSVFHKDMFLRVVGGMAWMYLWVFLWSLIPIVGIVFGTIRAYEYRFTPYILMNRPDVKPTEAIAVSKELTRGYKGKMFGADIFVALGFVLVTLVLTLLSKIPYIGILFLLILIVFEVVYALLINLFLGIVSAAFYVEIAEKPASSGSAPAPTPIPPVASVSEVPKTAPAPTSVSSAAPAPEAPNTAPAPEASGARFCVNCGAPVEAGQKFCTKCGNKL